MTLALTVKNQYKQLRRIYQNLNVYNFNIPQLHYLPQTRGKYLSIYKRYPQGSSTVMKSWKQSSEGQDQLHCSTAIFGHTTTVTTKEGKVYMTIEGCVKEKINIFY
jgi:hypothetical protein